MNEIQNKTESLLEIIKGIETQRIMLPEFQRDFRWELQQTYDLFDSLIDEIFIGTIIYGKPTFGMTLREIDTRPRKGKGSTIPLKTIDYTTNQIKQLAQTDNLRIVLDGQQRITSIFRAVTGLDSVYLILRDDINIDDLAHLSLEEMTQSITGEESAFSISVKLSEAYYAETHGCDDDDLNDLFAKTAYFKKSLVDVSEQTKKAASKMYRRVLRKLIDLYKQQKLVSFYLLEMSIKKFCVFFERSNSRGIQLNFTDILAAKLYHGFNLRKKVEEFESQNNTFSMNREIIIRAIAFIVGSGKKGILSIDKDFILEHLDAPDFEAHWDTTCRLYADSLQYLINQHYILSQSWIPSENIIIPIMMFLRKIRGFDRMSEEQKQFLEYWYWAAVFSNRYSGSSNEMIIADSTALTQVANNEQITLINYFTRLRPLITEPGDLFSYTKKSSAMYRGILNLLGYASQGLRDWNSTHKIDATMILEDHHIYPRAYIASGPKMEGMKQNEAEQLVDCVVNRTLIPKVLNIQIGKKAPTTYLAELRQKVNPDLASCLASHLIPEEMITDATWNHLFKLFLEERAQRIFDLIENYTTERSATIISRYSILSNSNTTTKEVTKSRLKDMISDGRILVGDGVFTLKNPDKIANIVDGDTVEFEGQRLSINTWGQKMTGWSTINIYHSVYLQRTGQPLHNLRREN